MGIQAALHQAHKDRIKRLSNVAIPPKLPSLTIVKVQPPPKPPPLPLVVVHADPPEWTATSTMILHNVAKAHGLRTSDIRSPFRLRHLVLARHEAMYLMVMGTALSLPQIAAKIGVLDHTTVWYGARKHAKRHGLPIPPDRHSHR